MFGSPEQWVTPGTQWGLCSHLKHVNTLLISLFHSYPLARLTRWNKYIATDDKKKKSLLRFFFLWLPHRYKTDGGTYSNSYVLQTTQKIGSACKHSQTYFNKQAFICKHKHTNLHQNHLKSLKINAIFKHLHNIFRNNNLSFKIISSPSIHLGEEHIYITHAHTTMLFTKYSMNVIG